MTKEEWHDNNETPKGGKGGYEALMVEKETRQKFKEKKPANKTNSEFLEMLLFKKITSWKQIRNKNI